MTPDSPKALLFDLGKVLVPFDFKPAYATMRSLTGLDAAEIRTRLNSTALVRDFETGHITAADFAAEVVRLLGLRCDLAAFSRIWNSIFGPETLIPDTWIESLRAHYRLLVVSNTNSLHFEMLRQAYPIFRHFDGYVLSYEVGAMKPDPRFYAAALEMAGCAPEECVFIDDLPENVAGATQAGFQGILFESFAQLSKEFALRGISSPFEAAVDAIVSGHAATLERLLSENPELIRMRSAREHRSTLLHYVSANGVEDFRQKTPANIVEIARILLDAGSDVKAESLAYGGGSTTLGLTATSCHPENAGVQLPLMELLIGRGATLDGVNSCLRNGRGQAAEFLASHGAHLDLEGAAGVGRLEIVKEHFEEDGSLKSSATEEQMKDGFAWACEFGRTGVVDFLLQRGMDIAAKLRHYGNTGLHWAAYGGHPDTVKLLLERGASIAAKDEKYDGTPLEWALHAAGNSGHKKAPPYDEVVELLKRAGAE
jgi:epoxide hydrolase-like predicted phosphatase